MPTKDFALKLGFIPKENVSGIFIKKYSEDQSIEIDFEKNTFHFGGKIKIGEKDSQNITKPEDWVVLECVNRLLQKGYKPENISLEKVYPAGHGFSGRLDICVTRDDGSEYLLIECKTYGKEFDKEFNRINKDGGQLFTYFKFSNKADVIMLYASELKGNDLVYRNEIIKIEDDYRTGDVKDFYEKWNKLTKDNGVFDSWVNPYNFESKALTINDLEEIRQEDSSFIFNRFLEILRHNVVSDKGNAFNRIFTLFLCKIYDEKTNEGTNNELGFQWLEGIDTHRTFQLRLTDLYKNGMYEFLEKVVTDFSETEFKNRFPTLTEEQRNPIIEEFRKLRLEKNNEFAIKDVYDEQSFNENAVVVKEIVQLLEKYKLRYTKKQQYLSDFFELLLTTGLKQESGQFFTPVPVAQFVIKSLPIDTILEDKLASAKIANDTLLPYVMDYAAGSGHFLTETMHEMQRLLDKKDDKKYSPSVATKIRNWKDDHFAWAIQYVYGIEKDYRLVKVGKVGCYLHGDGLANVIHSDGLANFSHPDYKGKLLNKDKDFPQENKQFDIIVSNPPYSVSAFKNSARSFYKDGDFDLYNKLTDNSSEIECLFIERTKQLLKDGGVAGIILPSSILSNTGIYSKSREIILQYFDLVGITELGSNTFMATGTNTVTLFLRRRNNYESANIKIAVEKFFTNFQDVTINGIEKPVAKYINHVWEGISFEDYISLLKKEPNKAIIEHEIYKEYQKKLKSKNDKEFFNLLLDKELDKLYYFIIAYKQKVVLIKSGEKDAEKRFLGYEFSNRRGSEGIHPIQRGKNIEDCTKLFDSEVFDNPEKASTYIYKAFAGDYDFPIDEVMQNNVSRHNLVDMLTFDRVDFEKNISLSVKKKVVIDSKYQQDKVENVFIEIKNGKNVAQSDEIGDYRVSRIESIADATFNINATKWTTDKVLENDFLQKGDILLSHINSVEHLGKTAYFNLDEKIVHGVNLLRFRPDKSKVLAKYASEIFKVKEFIFEMQKYAIKAANQASLNSANLKALKIPLPPIDIQQKIVSEIEVLEAKEKKVKDEVEKFKVKSNEIFNLNVKTTIKRLDEICELKAGDFVKVGDISKEENENLFPCFGGNGLRGYVKTFTHEGKFSLVGRQGALCGNVHLVEGKFHATEHALVATPLSDIDSTWLHYKLVEINLNQYATGTAQPGLSVMNLKPIEISVPSLSEQQKIVSEIEKIETKITILEKEIAEIPKQKEAVLKKYL
ncbi:restriction endonuclease subunit S [Pedobacter mendelii]|uniref:site-specific DNA-methyltransferase (adenine-specific) n=1 Tax=Pedobacter mendelii TaxID=1908240 RepID=A0ABQ2BI68_9SPHI|nr:restriction endonuclease subunit S [Pedobacter mendelii]GGI26668.1 restriction endonuclease [Pedobacter mendelii]